MNNNRNNNRRRGRSNNRQQGGQQLNRIDSRARGNAQQLLDKYRKLAHDAHLNGDRVQEEYYLQFADHYFRVLADQRQRQDEQREQRQQRWEGGGEQGQWREDGEESAEYAAEGEYPSYDQQPNFQRAPRQERDERGNRDDRSRDDGYREERPRQEAREETRGDSRSDARGESGEGGNQYESSDNPFVREGRNQRGLRPRREGGRQRQNRDEFEDRGDAPQLGLDPSSLPPAISAGREEAPVEFASEEGAEAEAKPRRRTRKPKPPADDAGEKLEAIT